jgi:formylglycine-generating enzyme required for sulfatase activity
MVHASALDIWVDIYLQSGTGAATRSANGATITDTRDWLDFTDDLAAVGKRMLSDSEFQVAAAGSNEKANILGSADPITTGAHVDTASRRMISNIGCEDMCGALWQWLLAQSYRNDDAGYSGAWVYYTLPGNKGSLYRQSGSGDIKLLAGGTWAYGTHCGSRSRNAAYSRWYAASNVGSRGCARRQG